MSGVAGNVSMFTCKLCDIIMTGPENYQQHMEGKKHLKKLKNMRTNAMEDAQEQANTISAKQDIPKPPAMNGAPKLPLNLPREPTAGELIGTSNDDPVMNAVKANLLGKLPLKKVAYERRCDICGVDYTSQTHEEQHLLGKKHMKKVKANAECANKATFYCGFCNLQVNSVEQMDQHRAGSAHLKKVANARKDQVEHTQAKKKFVPSSGSELMDSQLMPPPDTTLPVLQPLTYDK